YAGETQSMNESQRLASVRSLHAVGAGTDPATDAAARLAADFLDCPIALVTLLDEDIQWFKANVGMDGCSTPRKDSFCAHALALPARDVMVVEDAYKDIRFRDNPYVVGSPGIRFYAGALLTGSDGANLGTLCVIDVKPRARPSEACLNRLRDLARLVVSELERARAE
ncbi:hypothetical protein LTR94_032049, partial [Friedmanniomyces endolithicus]